MSTRFGLSFWIQLIDEPNRIFLLMHLSALFLSNTQLPIHDPTSGKLIHAGGLARVTSGSVRMHLSLPLHKKHLGFGTNNSICWNESDNKRSRYFSNHLCDWSGASFSPDQSTNQLKRKAVHATPIPRPKKRRFLEVPEEQSPPINTILKSSTLDYPRPHASGSPKQPPPTSVPINGFGDCLYVSSDDLTVISDDFTDRHQEKHDAILKHLDDDLVNSHPEFLAHQWPPPPNFGRILSYFIAIRSDVPPTQYYGLKAWEDISPGVFNDLAFNEKTGHVAAAIVSLSPTLLRDLLAPLSLESVIVIGSTQIKHLPATVCNTHQEVELLLNDVRRRSQLLVTRSTTLFFVLTGEYHICVSTGLLPDGIRKVPDCVSPHKMISRGREVQLKSEFGFVRHTVKAGSSCLVPQGHIYSLYKMPNSMAARLLITVPESNNEDITLPESNNKARRVIAPTRTFEPTRSYEDQSKNSPVRTCVSM